jgi:hypothetical protein
MVRAEGVAQRPLPPIARPAQPTSVRPARPTSVDKVGAARRGETHRGGGGVRCATAVGGDRRTLVVEESGECSPV